MREGGANSNKGDRSVVFLMLAQCCHPAIDDKLLSTIVDEKLPATLGDEKLPAILGGEKLPATLRD